MSLAQKLKVALIQFSAGADKNANISLTKKLVTEAASKGAKLVVLPECFNSPYSVTAFPQYAEQIPGGQTFTSLSELARNTQVFLVGGSIPEKSEDGKFYNSNVDFDPAGKLIGKHRKAHLFDIDVPGKITFKESEVLTSGNQATVVNLPDYGTIGIGICYDMRFPEMVAAASRQNHIFAQIYPGAFNLTTGPLHWSLLARARAVDNQIYVLACSPARDTSAGYHAYGHSMVVDPWGNVLAEAGESQEIIYADLDPAVLTTVRQSIPISTQRRFDIYPDLKNTKIGDGLN